MSRRGALRPVTDETGAVLIEFAFSLPLLLLIIVGLFDFGFALQKYQVITNAAREGARMAVLPGYSEDDVLARVKNYVSASGITDKPTVTRQTAFITLSGGTTATAMTVRVTIPHTFVYLRPIATMFGGSFGTITLSSQLTMRTEVG